MHPSAPPARLEPIRRTRHAADVPQQSVVVRTPLIAANEDAARIGWTRIGGRLSQPGTAKPCAPILGWAETGRFHTRVRSAAGGV
jgi:hypothetical protein